MNFYPIILKALFFIFVLGLFNCLNVTKVTKFFKEAVF